MGLLLIDTDIASFVLKGSDYADPYLPLLSGQIVILIGETIQVEILSNGENIIR